VNLAAISAHVGVARVAMTGQAGAAITLLIASGRGGRARCAHLCPHMRKTHRVAMHGQEGDGAEQIKEAHKFQHAAIIGAVHSVGQGIRR